MIVWFGWTVCLWSDGELFIQSNMVSYIEPLFHWPAGWGLLKAHMKFIQGFAILWCQILPFCQMQSYDFQFADL